uniref:Uncharacterized protein n=1 Tax=Romanomermis culicivorax TaxID=13658 RepID=A0A915ILM7_ROMCU
MNNATATMRNSNKQTTTIMTIVAIKNTNWNRNRTFLKQLDHCRHPDMHLLIVQRLLKGYSNRDVAFTSTVEMHERKNKNIKFFGMQEAFQENQSLPPKISHGQRLQPIGCRIN